MNVSKLSAAFTGFCARIPLRDAGVFLYLSPQQPLPAFSRHKVDKCHKEYRRYDHNCENHPLEPRSRLGRFKFSRSLQDRKHEYNHRRI